MATPPNSSIQPQVGELGYPRQLPPPPQLLPPNAGAYPAPYYTTFQSILNYAWRGYFWSYDEAVRDNFQSALAMRRDPVIYRALRIRQIPTVQLDWTLEPQDETDEQQVKNAAKLKSLIERIPELQGMKLWLNEALFWGRSAVQFKTQFDYLPTGDKVCFMAGWKPINGDKIRFKWDDGRTGIMVSSAAYPGTWEPTDRGPCHFFTPEEEQLVLVHRFEREDEDYWEGTLAGAVEGLGFRGRLYWWWWLRNNLQRIVMDFLQKIALGINVVWYDISNPQSLTTVQGLWNNQPGNNVMFMPRDPQRETPYGLDRYDPPASGSEIFYKFMELLNEQMEGAILMETLTHSAEPTGVGAGAADAHQTTAEVRTKYDAVNLDQTMQKLVTTLNRWNCPGNPEPQYRSAVDKPDPGAWMEAASWFLKNGGTIATKHARETLGIPTPDPGEEIMGGMAPMQPAALNTVPQGVPISGTPGPSSGVAQSQGQLNQ